MVDVASFTFLLSFIFVARDHKGVAAVLDSGLRLHVNLQSTTVTMTRYAAGQLSVPLTSAVHSALQYPPAATHTRHKISARVR